MIQMGLFDVGNPMVVRWGNGPVDKVCEDCLYYQLRGKCGFRGDEVDHDGRWRSCGKFEQVGERVKIPEW